MATQDKPQSFEDHEFFPSFHDCPGESLWDSRYFRDTNPDDPDGGAGTHRKHWCLLGEIIEADTIIRPRIVAVDYQGNKFVVAFYPDNEDDMPRLLQRFKVGNTIAIFYPLVHLFLDGSTGTRIEESDEVLIIPLKLKDVIEMNKQVVKYAPTDNSPPKCHGCDEVKENPEKCGGCKMFSYCDKECQLKAWKEKEHNKYCKVLADENVRYMNFLKYDTYNGSVSFK
ncbi:hypothetical protein AAE478_002503 [Parahypoxylon ruwenzoriense]